MELDGKLYKEPFDLTPEDLKVNPVWEYRSGDDDENISDTIMCPVEDLPVSSLDGRTVGAETTLANGSKVWVSFWNVCLDNPRESADGLSIGVFKNLTSPERFYLARYYDGDYEKAGPEALATFLCLPVDAVFPINYDISAFCKGDPASLRGVIDRKPKERLTDDDRREFARERSRKFLAENPEIAAWIKANARRP